MANRAEGAAAGDREALQNLFLDVARVLVVFGALGATSAGEPVLAFLSLLLWLLGVWLLALVLVLAAGRFPHLALAATAMAIAILKNLLALWN
ncbi:uncharacterized protein LOC100277039 [Zea mays]|uniref:Uncharacterized protein n=1 Tax=Zea mays TaxID=4577 RepID=B6TN45_MAIZE|nr:uncharacterized protein LOC100277039 [Zea mays]ACG38528.1 hypothetical protein [Zea mays]|eukprot:NP_001144182.1 uncharacterized protein LOC100277039 [Zea mays]